MDREVKVTEVYTGFIVENILIIKNSDYIVIN